MQITKELIEKDIVSMEAQVEQLKASLDKSSGALAVLKNIRDYLDAPYPEPEVKTEISETNKAVQDNLEALSLQEVAEQIAGPGAEVEIEPMEAGGIEWQTK